jgi:glycerol-3-phosphate dehydrogenase
MPRDVPPVLILGAGINGIALARELILNCVPVVLVDAADLASGATSASSRLIHGGLRYLEFGEFDLVRESLAERTRLLRLAPHLVRPLELFIPIGNRFGGLAASARRFLGGEARGAPQRGLWLVRAGLSLYDHYARDPHLPRHRVYRVSQPGCLPVDRSRFHWLCSYYDAQVPHPERLALALLEDARQAAGEAGVPLQVSTHHRVRRANGLADALELVRSDSGAPGDAVTAITPSAVVNATGAWVDWTLRELGVASRPLIGGTKGSHLVTAQEELRRTLAGRGIYAEAADGRPFFVLPLGQSTLIGTTDVPFTGDPRQAVASEEEIEYLLASVNEVLPGMRLTRDDLDWHYSGVRPLPATGGVTPAAITRRHWLEEHPGQGVPCYSIIGGKLTTCRSLAEQSAARILKHLGRTPTCTTRQRILPGGENCPADRTAVAAEHARLARQTGLEGAQVAAAWELFGTRTEAILSQCGKPARANLDGTCLPIGVARWVIEHQWVGTLEDLVERRLMLLDHPRLTRVCLAQLAALLADAGKLPAHQVDAEADRLATRLQSRYGKRLLVRSSIRDDP